MRKTFLNLTKEELRQRFDKEKLTRDFPSEADLIRYLYHEEKLSRREVGMILGCSRTTVGRKMQKYGIEIRSLAEALIVAGGHADERKPFDADDREKCYLMGFVKGDCTATKQCKNSQTIVVSCGSTKKEQIELFRELFRPYGHIWEGRPRYDGEVNVSVALDLESFAWLLKAYEKDELHPLVLANDENFFAFLGGYSDAEAFIGIKGGKAVFALASCNQVILRQIYERLVKLDIKFPKPRIRQPEGTFSIDSDGKIHKHNKDCWCLETMNKGSLLKLFKRIGPYLRHKKRIAGMKTAIRNIEERNARWERVQQREERFARLLSRREELLSSFSNEAELIRYLYGKELLSQTMISEILGCDRATVSRRMKRYGIKARDLSEAKRLDCGYELMV